MDLIVRCVAPAEGVGIESQWAVRYNDAVAQAEYEGCRFDYRLWPWRRYIQNTSYLCFGVFDGARAESLAACSLIEYGLEIDYVQTAPDNYYTLGDLRAQPGAGRALIASLAKICHLYAGDAAELRGRNALLESISFYDRLGFVRGGGYDPRERVFGYVALRVPPLTALIAQRYDVCGITGAEEAVTALRSQRGGEP